MSSRKNGVMHHVVLTLSSSGRNLTYSLLLGELSGALFTSLLLRLALLQKSLWDGDIVVSWNGTVEEISIGQHTICMEEGAK